MMTPRRLLLTVVVLATFIALPLAGTALASPAPVEACPPCSRGFTQSAAEHGIPTEIQTSSATVRVHANDTATWTARVVPTNASVLDRLAANASLARAVAADSFGVRYGEGIDHELLGVRVTDEAVLIRYHTHDVVERGPFGTRMLTYFRDEPGAYIYSGLGADELTVIAPDGMTVAHGFGDVSDDRLTATALPGVQDGPFVVFAPAGSPVPGLVGTLAVASALGGVIVRNVALFVALPAGVLLAGLAALRRFVDPTGSWSPRKLGGLVAVGGAVLLVVTPLSEAGVLPVVTGNLLLGGLSGAVLLGLGGVVAMPQGRRLLTPARLVVAGLAIGVAAALATGTAAGAGTVHRTLAMAAALLPAIVGLGWADADADRETHPRTSRLFAGVGLAVIGGLAYTAPLTALGGTLFLLVPVLLTIGAVVGVLVAVPLYLLGAAGATAVRDAT